VIPADYVSSGEIDYVKLTHDPLSSSGYAESMEWLLLYNLAGQDQALAAGLWQPLDLTLTSTAPVTEESAEENWMVELLPTMMTLILYMVIVITSSSLIAAVAEEKKNRVMEILLSSVSPNQFISGKILALGVLGLMMLAAWLGVLWMVIAFGGQSLSIPLDFELPTRLVVWAFVFGLMGYLMYGALMAGIGALAPDVKDTRSLSLVVMSPIILAYMFNIFISNAPEGGLALFATLFPLTSPVSMIMRMTLVDVPLWQLLLAVALQLVTALGIVRLAARLFRAQILLSGQPVSVKRFVGALVRG
jgi:ABC-2 type transport system permease protein